MVHFAVICASNQNRSMEAHHVLSKKRLDVHSFGTNSSIKIPGPTADKPNIYAFGTTYEEIFQDLKAKDAHLYTQNGLLQMLDRNRKIKPKPERFQDTALKFDVIFTCEERCFNIVTDELNNQSSISTDHPAVYVVNFEIEDNQEDATVGARSVLQLALAMESSADLEAEFESLMEDFQSKTTLSLLYTVCFY